MAFTIPHPAELQARLHAEVKVNKFNELVEFQKNWIETNMRNGYDFASWIFGDSAFFKTPLEKSFREEFEVKAKLLFEEAGYIVKDPVITWEGAIKND